MNKKLRVWIVLIMLSVLGTLSVGAQAVTKEWNNPAGGRWDAAANWAPAGVPQNGDDVVITLPGTYIVYYVPATGNTSFASLTLGGAFGTQTLSKAAYPMTLTGASVINSTGVVTQTSGSIGGSGDLAIAGTFNWNGGVVDGSGALAINVGGILRMEGGNKVLGRNTTNAGNVLWLSGLGSLGLTPGTTLTNNSGFVIQTQAPIARSGVGSNPSFVNNGTLIKRGGGTTQFTSVNFTNTRALVVYSGTLGSSAASFTQTSGATTLAGGNLSTTSTININGGELKGDGDISGSLSNGGLLIPGNTNTAGVITVSGNYTQTATGEYRVNIGGTVAATGYDVLNVGGDANLSGTLRLTLINGFDPQPGDEFEILTTKGSRNGQFSAVDNQTGESLFTEYNPQDVIIVVPVP